MIDSMPREFFKSNSVFYTYPLEPDKYFKFEYIKPELTLHA